MDEKENHRAEVLLGRRDKYSNGDPLPYDYRERTYTLVIDGKYNSGQKNGEPAEVAAHYATRLRELGISDYTLVNGERIRFTNFEERVKVPPMFQEDVDTFKETLDAKLNA
tara:strand:+ start:200 stop:532 length:333 start_codon:yes stop_codon:yes gene_type:complete